MKLKNLLIYVTHAGGMGFTKKNITFAPKLPNGDENNLLIDL